MKVELTNFSKRHFNNDFSGTKILDVTSDKFMEELQYRINTNQVVISDGYADFCKLAIVPNWTNTRSGTLPITPETLPYLRSGYSARTESELPVLTRWLDIPSHRIDIAKYLVIVLYTKEQLDKESVAQNEQSSELQIDTEYGVVAILAQLRNEEEPMTPITMLRNALGIEEGGSGYPMDREKYKISVDFWDKNASIK